jgi:hypothetical protein
MPAPEGTCSYMYISATNNSPVDPTCDSAAHSNDEPMPLPPPTAASNAATPAPECAVSECNTLLSVCLTWTGSVVVQHVTWFSDTMYDENRSPACEKA